MQHGIQARIAGLRTGLVQDAAQRGEHVAQGQRAGAVLGRQGVHAADAGLFGGQHQAFDLRQASRQGVAQQQVFAGLGGHGDLAALVAGGEYGVAGGEAGQAVNGVGHEKTFPSCSWRMRAALSAAVHSVPSSSGSA